MFKIKKIKFLIIFISFSLVTCADKSANVNNESYIANENVTSQAETKIRKILAKNFKNIKIEDIKFLDKINTYQVSIKELNYFFYFDKNLSSFVIGDLFKLDNNNNVVNVTNITRNKNNLKNIADAKKVKNPIIKKAKGKIINEIIVFTDPYCPYCVKFHKNIEPELLKKGISIRYLFYPFIKTNSYDTAVSILCSNDPIYALDQVISNQNIKNKKCTTDLENHVELARRFNIRGTPLIVLPTGEIINGLAEANYIIQSLN